MYAKIEKFIARGLQELVYQIPDDEITVNNEEYQKEWIDDLMMGKTIRFYESLASQMNTQCDHMYQDKAFLNKMKALNFDLAVMDGYDFALCNYLFPASMGIPYITVTPSIDTDITNIPALPSFVPSIFDTHSHRMNFWERFSSFCHYFLPSWKIEWTPKKFFNDSLFDSYKTNLDPEIQSYNDLPKRSLMSFITRGHMLEWPSLSTPNVLQVECLTAGDVTQTPAEFQVSQGHSN